MTNLLRSIVFWIMGITLGQGQNKKYLARTMPQWKVFGFSLIVGIIISILLVNFIPESLSNFLQNQIPNKDTDFYFFTELGICVVISIFVIGLPLNKFIRKAIGEINQCPKCSNTSSFELQEEKVVNEQIISKKTNNGYKNYRVGTKTGYFKCRFCGFEDSLDTSYKKSA